MQRLTLGSREYGCDGKNMVGNVDFSADEKGSGMQVKECGFYLLKNGEIPGLEKRGEVI